VVCPWPATRDHTVTLSSLPLLGWEEEWKEKGKTLGSEQGQFNRRANEVNSNNDNTDQKNIQNKQ